MSDQYPQLIFVTGLQKGQRVRLGQPVCVFGRGAGVDVMLSEEYVSRRQFRYELLRAGPTIENLSRRGTWISGKRYKSGRKVLMASGDVIGVGADTQILFVAAGDDLREVLRAWQASPHAGRDAFGRRISPPAAPAPPPEPEPAQPPQAQPEPEPDIRPSEMTADERAEMERKAKRKKLLVGLGAYWALLMLAGVVLYLGVKNRPAGGVTEERMLTGAEIAEHMEQVRARTPNLDKSRDKLIEAKNLYGRYNTSPRHLHKIVAAYKEAIACSGEDHLVDDVHHEIYRECLDALTVRVQKAYLQACLYEKNKDWAAAEPAFWNLLRMIGDQQNPVFVNVRGHYARVKHYRKKAKPKKTSPFG